MDKKEIKMRSRRILDPAVGALAAMGIPPLLVTIVGLIFSLYGAVVVAEGSLALGAVFLIASGLCDVLDGDLARRRDMVSRFGAFIDSSLDRVAEFAYFTGILVYTVNRPGGFDNFTVVVIMIALTGSVLTSYTRARAEGVGYECTVGALERPERIVLLTLGLLLGYRILIAIVTVIAIASTVTVLQRILHVYRLARKDDDPVKTGSDSKDRTQEN
jgi:CDP-diacylglycerol--glycerol-3-phosphate 3-phosphatidyltransferase